MCSLSASDIEDLLAVLKPAPVAAVPAAAPSAAPAAPTAPPVRLRPAPMPEPSPVFSTSSDSEVDYERPEVTKRSLDIIPNVRKFLGDYQLRPLDLLPIINEPDDEWLDESGTRTVVVRGEIAVVLGMPRQVVIAVMWREHAERRRPASLGTAAPKIRRSGGGVGTRYPTTLKEMHDLLRERGCDVSIANSGHVSVSHPSSPKRYSSAATPSDKHSLMNMAKGIERELGIDLRRSGR